MVLRTKLLSVGTLILALAAARIDAQETVAAPDQPCAVPPPATGKSRQNLDSTPLMAVAGILEAQGEADFHVKFAAPAKACHVETFQVGNASVTATYNPWEAGPSTLLYRFHVKRPETSSDIVVLHSGTAALLGRDDYYFHLSEERDGIISWYAAYHDIPAYPSVRSLIEQIIVGGAKPLLAVRWPAGAKEGEALAFDSERLK